MSRDLPEIEPTEMGQSRVDHVVTAMSDWIVGGRFQPGERLPPEGRLTEHFAVSRTVIREAVRLLAERGLIEVAHGKRHRVRPPSPQIAASHLHRMVERGGVTCQELMELRWPLESEIALVAARRRTGAHLQQMRCCLDEEAPTIDAQIAQDMRFHKLLARATGNTMLEMALDVFALPMTESRRQSLVHAGHRRTLEQHQAILEAVAAGDGPEAKARMKAHLDAAMEAWQSARSEEHVSL
ncbi:MAG: FadR/GntR family transcriptional regulator [bacterium]